MDVAGWVKGSFGINKIEEKNISLILHSKHNTLPHSAFYSFSTEPVNVRLVLM